MSDNSKETTELWSLWISTTGSTIVSKDVFSFDVFRAVVCRHGYRFAMCTFNRKPYANKRVDRMKLGLKEKPEINKYLIVINAKALLLLCLGNIGRLSVFFLLYSTDTEAYSFFMCFHSFIQCLTLLCKIFAYLHTWLEIKNFRPLKPMCGGTLRTLYPSVRMCVPLAVCVHV